MKRLPANSTLRESRGSTKKIASDPATAPAGNVGCTQRKRLHASLPLTTCAARPTPPQMTVSGSTRTILPCTGIRRRAIRRMSFSRVHATPPRLGRGSLGVAALPAAVGVAAGRRSGAPSPHPARTRPASTSIAAKRLRA